MNIDTVHLLEEARVVGRADADDLILRLAKALEEQAELVDALRAENERLEEQLSEAAGEIEKINARIGS